MKKYLLKALFFCLPFFLIILFFIYLDMFKVLRDYDDYYDDNPITLNRAVVCTKTYNKYRKDKGFDSFIFGNSRSQAFKCEKWSEYLGASAVPFHFDGHSEGIYGIARKLQYIDEMGERINNALLIVDRELLNLTHNREGYLYINHPSVSKESVMKFYMEFFKAQLDLKFNIAYFDYLLFGKYRDYMQYYIRRSKYRDFSNPINCDLFYGYDKHIESDYHGYYNELISKGIFYERPGKPNIILKVTDQEIACLKQIKEVFLKHGTKYKVLVSPLYDQIPLEKEQLALLRDIFGEANVFDFSGKNEFTDSIYNFYEASHYRPQVAEKIMEIIYTRQVNNQSRASVRRPGE